MSEIIVGYDGSDCSRAALDEACGLAKELGDKVVVVFGYAPGGYGGGEIPTHREAVEELGEQITAEAAERAERAGVEHEVDAAAAQGLPRGDRDRRRARRADDRRRQLRRPAPERGRSSARPRTSCCTSRTGRCWSCRLSGRRARDEPLPDVEADQLGNPGKQGADRVGSRPASSASSLRMSPSRIASPPIQWRGSGGTRGGEGSTKARREGASRRSRASEASVSPTMREGPTPLPV